MNSDLELIKALSELVVTADLPIEYRLHYNDSGDVYMCSMQNHPDSEKYIVVTKEQYDLYFKYKIVNGKLELIEHNVGIKAALVKRNHGFRVVKNNAALLLEKHEEYNNIEYYDHRNS